MAATVSFEDVEAAFGVDEFVTLDLAEGVVDADLLADAIRRHRSACLRLSIRSGTIAGRLRLDDLDLPALAFSKMQLLEGASFRDATMSSIGIEYSELGRLDFRRAVVNRGLGMQHVTINGLIELSLRRLEA